MSTHGPAGVTTIPALYCENPPGQHLRGGTARHGRFEPYGKDVGDGGPGGF
ncbi:hypothetical protein [Streptomyces sp. HUAS TT7]|uniref:hypothetical protein n=1 Tax=Streptomyces sp. HUAS TT7 TaxID=3447507 RepID=UPI003F658A29